MGRWTRNSDVAASAFITSPPVREAKYRDKRVSVSVSVSVSGCLFASISPNTFQFSASFCACYICPWLGPFLAPRDTMAPVCTSVFVDDVMFAPLLIVARIGDAKKAYT